MENELKIVGFGAVVTAILAVPLIKLQQIQINWYAKHPVATVVLSLLGYFVGYYGTKKILEDLDFERKIRAR